MAEDESDSPVPITRLRVKNFRSLADIDVELGSLSVLIGPNGSGKTNILRALSFLSDVARFDVEEALIKWGGIENVQRTEADKPPEPMFFSLEGQFGGEFQGPYTLEISQDSAGVITTREDTTHVAAVSPGVKAPDGVEKEILSTFKPGLYNLRGLGTMLSRASRYGSSGQKNGLIDLALFLKKIFSFDVNVTAARNAAPLKNKPLAADGGNLADALAFLRDRDSDGWGSLLFDAQRCLSGLQNIEVRRIGGAGPGVEVWLHEAGIEPIPLAQASYGTVRLLALLCVLHEPDPPPLLIFDEFDHGLHPHAIDMLVDTLRAASDRTQILVSTHSLALVNRLQAKEMIICDRDPETGESIIPAIAVDDIAGMLEIFHGRPGELWFDGSLGGVPQ